MLQLFILLIVALPIVELILLVKLGGWIGWIPTLAVVIGAGLAGTALARFEGWRAAMRVRHQMASGAIPAAEMLDGLLIGVAGVLLLIPGVLSDVLGLLLLLPPTRRLVRHWVMSWLRTRFRIQVVVPGADDGNGPRPLGDNMIDARVIETHVVD
jgi:UPF0716 protein FxsA